MKIVNLTPHTINILEEVGGEVYREVAAIPSSGIARITQSKTVTDILDSGVTLYKTSYGQVEGLPPQEPGTIYIVSALLRAACNRDDLYQPGVLIRDETGQPIGCLGLSR